MKGLEREAGFDPGAELGPLLRRVREDRGLSVRELARRISCSPSLISQIERGLSAPSVGILYAIATELRASLDFLFGSAVPGDAMLATAHVHPDIDVDLNYFRNVEKTARALPGVSGAR